MPISAVIVLLLVFATYGIVCVLVGARLTWCQQQQLPPPNPMPSAPVRVTGGDENGKPDLIQPPRSRL